MSQYKEATVADTVYLWFAANTTAGAAGDGASPLYDVRLAGAAADAAPTASGTPTLLSHANYTDGLHEIAIDTTGWSAGEYAVFCTLTISSVNPAGFCGSFKLFAAGGSVHDKLDAIPTAAEIQAEIEENGASLLDTIRDTLGAAGAGLTGIPDSAGVTTLLTRIVGTLLAGNHTAQSGDHTPAAVKTAIEAAGSHLTLIKAITDQIVFTVANRIDANALQVGDKTGYAIGTGGIAAAAFAANAIAAAGLAADAVDEILDEVVEGTTTFRQALRLFLSALTAKSSGGGTATVVFRDIGDTKNRISATVDADGNRTAVGTRDGT
jgi:hypothetical protein